MIHIEKGAAPEKFAKAADILRVISSANRLEIIQVLEEGGYKTVSEIQELTGIESTLLSHHLTKLKDKGILESYKKGRNKYYSLKIKELLKVLDCINRCDYL